MLSITIMNYKLNFKKLLKRYKLTMSFGGWGRGVGNSDHIYSFVSTPQFRERFYFIRISGSFGHPAVMQSNKMSPVYILSYHRTLQSYAILPVNENFRCYFGVKYVVVKRTSTHSTYVTRSRQCLEETIGT